MLVTKECINKQNNGFDNFLLIFKTCFSHLQKDFNAVKYGF